MQRNERSAELIDDYCYRALHAGRAAMDLVLKDKISPTLVLHCLRMFELSPYHPALYEQHAFDPQRVASLRFFPNQSAWQQLYGIPNVALWFEMAEAIIMRDAQLMRRMHYTFVSVQQEPAALEEDYEFAGDPWLLALFEMVYEDETLKPRCQAAVLECMYGRQVVQQSN